MTNQFTSRLKPLTLLLVVTLLFQSCKKHEFTVTELGNMAEAKLKELNALSTGIPCDQKDYVTIRTLSESTGCSASYYAVKSSDLALFNRLKKEYLELLSRQSDAMIKEGVIIDPCFQFIWVSEEPIRLGCNEGNVQLITPADLSVEEAKSMAAKTYEEIMTIVNAQTCVDESAWMVTPLIKDKIMEVEYVPYLRTVDYSAFKKKVSLYNSLKYHIIKAKGPIVNVPVNVKVEKINCVNGKPVIKLVD